MKLFNAWLALCACMSAVSAQVQRTFSAAASEHQAHTLDLATLASEGFTRFSHPAFPGRSARIKKSNFCDGGVASYTGYIDVGPKHFFFYFFESRSNPESDDVILWTNGGPGGSSATGLFMELGPCLIASVNSTKYNPYSWNSNANIFFIDQPIGTGYSYHDIDDVVSTTEDAAQDIAAFIAMFFETFSKFKGRGFHLAGESYGGRYIPIFGAAVYDQNPSLVAKGLMPINLKSLMIGNGATDFFSLLRSYYDMQCTNMGIGPLVPISACVRMKQVLPRCEQLQQKSCIEHFDLIDCNAAFTFCQSEIGMPYINAGYNVYDMSMKCDGLSCYPETNNIDAYLNDPSVRKKLGVKTPHNFTSIAYDVNSAFWATGDPLHETQQYLVELLARRVKVLIYAGSYDFICNWLGNERWTLNMDWPGREAFSNTPLTEWIVDGEPAGKTRQFGNFSFATIYGAGHLAPHDKPIQSLAMLQRWLADGPF
ncbi:hypothetical protein ACEPAI_3497 [Sanghuangporus weigelae]